MRYEILQGDVVEVLRSLPPESVHCCVTSPPYWGLRDYGTPGQLGLEPTPQAHVCAMVAVFEEVRRVLRKDGTCWLNYGDCYACESNGRKAEDVKALGADDRTFRDKPFSTVTSRRQPKNSKNGEASAVYGPNRGAPGLKPKDLVGMPWRIAFALQEAGWWLRSDIIWHKPNPMPESVTDRPTKAHEYLFLLAKSATYFYDAEAIREPGNPNAGGGPIAAAHRLTSGNDMQRRKAFDPSQAAGAIGIHDQKDPALYNGRNRRTVWTIPTQPYPEAHFATYPEDLVRPCILAGTSERGVCGNCGSPWRRVVENEYTQGGSGGPSGKIGDASGMTQSMPKRMTKHVQTLGWTPSCPCGREDTTPAVVLDPFCGSGTTLAVALQYGRRGLGVELNPDYIALAHRRIAPYAAQETLQL